MLALKNLDQNIKRKEVYCNGKCLTTEPCSTLIFIRRISVEQYSPSGSLSLVHIDIFLQLARLALKEKVFRQSYWLTFQSLVVGECLTAESKTKNFSRKFPRPVLTTCHFFIAAKCQLCQFKCLPSANKQRKVLLFL